MIFGLWCFILLIRTPRVDNLLASSMQTSYFHIFIQVVIGAASRVRYSVTVTALIAADAYTVFDERLKEAKRLQLQLPALMVEIRALKVERCVG